MGPSGNVSSCRNVVGVDCDFSFWVVVGILKNCTPGYSVSAFSYGLLTIWSSRYVRHRVRFYEEWVGDPELGATKNGPRFPTYLGESSDCEFRIPTHNCKLGCTDTLGVTQVCNILSIMAKRIGGSKLINQVKTLYCLMNITYRFQDSACSYISG